MVDLCNSTKGICLTGMCIVLSITPTLPSGIHNYSVFRELEVNDYIKELCYLLYQNLHIIWVIYFKKDRCYFGT